MEDHQLDAEDWVDLRRGFSVIAGVSRESSGMTVTVGVPGMPFLRSARRAAAATGGKGYRSEGTLSGVPFVVVVRSCRGWLVGPPTTEEGRREPVLIVRVMVGRRRDWDCITAGGGERGDGVGNSPGEGWGRYSLYPV